MFCRRAQVLAQTPQADSGGATYFVPGTGAQQTQNVWRYLHSDGLGSVRHVTGAAGQMRYTPFGEMTEQSGATSLFGFTGEPQGDLNDLVYLRARYYNPALGRFLTQDSLIPDVTNSQALNPYAYVYNDPVNLVDPSGNIPGVGSIGGALGDAAVGAAKRAPDSWKPGINNLAQRGNNFLNWWKSKPENCECSQRSELTANSALFINEWIANPGSQLVWSGATTPARRIAESVSYQVGSFQGGRNVYREIATRSKVDVTRWGPYGPHGKRSMGPSRSAYQVTILDDGYSVRTSGAGIRVKNPRLRLVEGMRGFEGAIVGAGYIDAGFQLLGDLISNLCLSPEQLAWRTALGFGFGVAAGAVGAVVGASVAGVGLVSYSAPALAGFVASTFATYKLRPVRIKVLDKITDALE